MENTDQYRFTSSHEWVINHGDGTATIGITDHAQEQLGDVVFVELPEADRDFKAGDEFSLVESVKAASDIYAPVSGRILAINEALNDAPETINESPLTEGWIARIQLDNPQELNSLLSTEQYQASLAETA